MNTTQAYDDIMLDSFDYMLKSIEEKTGLRHQLLELGERPPGNEIQVANAIDIPLNHLNSDNAKEKIKKMMDVLVESFVYKIKEDKIPNLYDFQVWTDSTLTHKRRWGFYAFFHYYEPEEV